VTVARVSTPTSPAPPSAAPSGRAWWRLPAPTESTPGWHVSPLVDLVAYHFSWLWILLPLALVGDVHPGDYLVLFAIGVTTSFVHRHVTMPYVYLDGAVFRAWKPRLTLMPLVLVCAFVASIGLQQGKAPARFIGPLDLALLVGAFVPVVDIWWRDRRGEGIADRDLIVGGAPFVVATVAGFALLPGRHGLFLAVVTPMVLIAVALVIARRRFVVVGIAGLIGLAALLSSQGVAVHERPFRTDAIVGAAAIVAAVWNIWHTAAQKVGILRVYNAKSSAPVEQKVPLWVDRLLVFSWFPFLAALLVDRERERILEQGKVVKMYLGPIVDGLGAAMPVLYPLGVIVIVGAAALFLLFEHRATSLRSLPRLSMAASLTLLAASFLVVSPFKCYIAWGFSHAIEYIVFVWAFQRRRYATPLSPPPLLQRLLRHGALLYGVFIAAIAALYLWSNHAVGFGWVERQPQLFGLQTTMIIYLWAIWHSMAHFYFDGFLWKMRPSVRAAL
jgi:hypothetical protein